MLFQTICTELSGPWISIRRICFTFMYESQIAYFKWQYCADVQDDQKLCYSHVIKIINIDFSSNQSVGALVRSLSEALCLVLWLRFSLGLTLTLANSIGSSETARDYLCCTHMLLWFVSHDAVPFVNETENNTWWYCHTAMNVYGMTVWYLGAILWNSTF